MMTDPELSERIAELRQAAPGAVPHPCAGYLDALIELRNWRCTLGFLRGIYGKYADGGSGQFPDIDVNQAIEHGILLEVPFDPAQHRDREDVGLEPGEPTFVLTPALKAILER